mmetsp:Transcript_42931/g.97109  ORF Transcript_42931/g.97109 Transcript_42931/m.97109 type:complete len:103 (+) Transcript_42931:333-641(+)
MTIVVRPTMARLTASCTRCSDSASRAEVASSRSSTRGSTMRARATATRCFCPPESRTPRSPTKVPRPSGNAAMKSPALAARTAAHTAASLGKGSPSCRAIQP